MITDQPVNNHDDMRTVTDNILRDAGMTIEDSGGKVTFAVVCDIMTGYLGAIGAKAALLRRAREGGSYVVRVTLTQCVQYMTSLGFNDKRVVEDYENLGEEHQIMKPELITGTTAFGEYTRPASQVEMSKTPQAHYEHDDIFNYHFKGTVAMSLNRNP